MLLIDLDFFMVLSCKLLMVQGLADDGVMV